MKLLLDDNTTIAITFDETYKNYTITTTSKCKLNEIQLKRITNKINDSISFIANELLMEHEV